MTGEGIFDKQFADKANYLLCRYFIISWNILSLSEAKEY